jgi:large subunit ribosomal protein L21
LVGFASPAVVPVARYLHDKKRKRNQMYAIIADGGRQYKVQTGQILEIDFRQATAGEEMKFERVLAIGGKDGIKLGKPTVEGATVSAKVIGETKGDKIFIQKFRRRKNSKRRTGHRQKYVKVQIGEIAG